MRKELFGIPIDWITLEELQRKLQVFVVSDKSRQITTVNNEFILLSNDNPDFQSVLESSDLSLPDSMGIVVAQTLADQALKTKTSRFLALVRLFFQGLFLPHTFPYKRITGVDLSEMLMQLAAEHHWRVYLLGAKPGIAQKAGDIWQHRYPGLTIVGATDDNPGDPQTLTHITAAKPDILLVAYGAPKQDLFIAQHKDRLKVPIMVGVGGTFDYVAGALYRPPAFIRAIGLEWLARLIQQPKRFKRIWRSTVGFSSLLITRQPN